MRRGDSGEKAERDAGEETERDLLLFWPFSLLSLPLSELPSPHSTYQVSRLSPSVRAACTARASLPAQREARALLISTNPHFPVSFSSHASALFPHSPAPVSRAPPD